MAVPKRKGTRVANNVMEHPLLHHFDAGPSSHFGTQNNVAGIKFSDWALNFPITQWTICRKTILINAHTLWGYRACDTFLYPLFWSFPVNCIRTCREFSSISSKDKFKSKWLSYLRTTTITPTTKNLCFSRATFGGRQFWAQWASLSPALPQKVFILAICSWASSSMAYCIACMWLSWLGRAAGSRKPLW